MALYFEWRINKIALIQTVFLAILPTGKSLNQGSKTNKKKILEHSRI